MWYSITFSVSIPELFKRIRKEKKKEYFPWTFEHLRTCTGDSTIWLVISNIFYRVLETLLWPKENTEPYWKKEVKKEKKNKRKEGGRKWG